MCVRLRTLREMKRRLPFPARRPQSSQVSLSTQNHVLGVGKHLSSLAEPNARVICSDCNGRADFRDKRGN